MANQNVELKTNLFEEEELSDADLMAIAGGGVIQGAEATVINTQNTLLAKQFDLVYNTTTYLGTNGQ